MRPIARRLRRLEDRFVPRDDPEARRLVELLHERIRRRYEAEGKTYIPLPPMNITGLTLAEAILRGRDRARQTPPPWSHPFRYSQISWRSRAVRIGSD
jgi:hypothetical protein